MDVIDQPHGIGAKIENADHARLLDPHSDRGKHRRDDNEQADPTVPGENSQGNIKKSKNDLKRKRALLSVDATTVNRIGAYRRKVCRHARPRPGQKILHAKGELTAYAQKR